MLDEYNAMKMLSQIKYTSISRIIPQIDVPYAIVKGEITSLYSYKKLGERKYQDIDFLVELKNCQKLIDLFSNYGFYQSNIGRSSRIFAVSSSHQVLPLEKKLTDNLNIKIDLNFDVFWGEYIGRRIDIHSFLEDSIEVDIYGIKVKTLPILKSFVHLILHDYKDLNSIYLLSVRKNINSNMFKDIYYMIKNNQESLSVKQLYEISCNYKIVPYVYYMLFYTYLIYEDDFLNEYLNVFKCDDGEKLLNCYGLAQSEQKKWKCDFKTRMQSNDIYSLIKDDLTPKDQEKIRVNKEVFFK